MSDLVVASYDDERLTAQVELGARRRAHDERGGRGMRRSLAAPAFLAAALALVLTG